MRTIEVRGIPLAITGSLLEFTAGKRFITDGKAILQVGVLNFSPPAKVEPHTHKNKKEPQKIEAMEFLLVSRGKAYATIYDAIGAIVASFPLYVGDFLIQLAGGHGFTFDKDTQMIEVKSGPYTGHDDDKVML